MKTYIAVLVLSFVTALLTTPWVRLLALRLGAVDQPDVRKVHTAPTPRMGGLAVFAGFFLPWVLFYLVRNRVALKFQDYETLLLALAGGSFAMLILGIYDDLRGANVRLKLLFQLFTALAMYYAGYRITVLSNPFGPPLELGWLSLPVSLLWIVGLTNAINLLDGIDGLAAGVAGCIGVALALINIRADNIVVALLTIGVTGASLGFLPHNFSRVKTFLGDTGSLLLGFLLACIGMLSLFKAVTATMVLVPLLVFGLPILDTGMVVVGRLWRGASLFEADKTHVHHRLLQLGWSHKEASFFLYGITMALTTVAVDLSSRQSPSAFVFAGLYLSLLLAVLLGLLRRRGSTPPTSPGSRHTTPNASEMDDDLPSPSPLVECEEHHETCERR